MNIAINSKTLSTLYTPGSEIGGNSNQPIGPKFSSKAPDPPEDVLLKSFRSNWTEVQSRALASLVHAVDEASVYVALIGSAGSGTSDVLAALLTQSKQANRICISIRNPSRFSDNDAREIKQVISINAGDIKNRSLHLLIGVHDAHAASTELFEMISFFARSRDHAIAPQVIIAGEHAIWECLSIERYKTLRERFALRLAV